jgi:hypothetical protein
MKMKATHLVLFTIRPPAGRSDVWHTFIAPDVPKYPHGEQFCHRFTVFL